MALLGSNGAGKTTAIATLLGLRRPDEGTARLFGADPRRPSTRRDVGATPQETTFPATLRVREVVELVRAHYERPVPSETLYDRFELGRLVNRQFGGLSGGERRRVGVALAFAGKPRLVVLDEPTAGLDREARLAVWEAIRAHTSRRGCAPPDDASARRGRRARRASRPHRGRGDRRRRSGRSREGGRRPHGDQVQGRPGPRRSRAANATATSSGSSPAMQAPSWSASCGPASR